MHISILALTFIIPLALVTASVSESSIEIVIDQTRNTQKDFIVCDGLCPDYLGIVTIYANIPSTVQDASKFKICLSTLIAPDVIITNAHCVPEESLRKFIRVVFPKSKNHPAESVKIKELLKISDTRVNPLLDYAILKLDSTLSRGLARVSGQSIKKDKTFIVYTHSIKVNKESGLNFIRLKSQTCNAAEDTNSDGIHNVTMKLVNCMTVGGDSGGPILAPHGNFVGIVWGGGINVTYGVNSMCLPGLWSQISEGKCAQTIDLALFRLVQSIELKEFSSFDQMGSRAPIAFEILEGKIYLNSLRCYSEIPSEPFQIKGTEFIVSQADLNKISLPLEIPLPIIKRQITLVFYGKDGGLNIKVLDTNSSELNNYTIIACSKGEQ